MMNPMSAERIKFDLEKYSFVDEKGNVLETKFEYLKGKKAITVIGCHGEHREPVDIVMLLTLAQNYILGTMNKVEKKRLGIVEECGMKKEFENQVEFIKALYRRAGRDIK